MPTQQKDEWDVTMGLWLAALAISAGISSVLAFWSVSPLGAVIAAPFIASMVAGIAAIAVAAIKLRGGSGRAPTPLSGRQRYS
jgi:hypothetical protein